MNKLHDLLSRYCIRLVYRTPWMLPDSLTDCKYQEMCQLCRAWMREMGTRHVYPNVPPSTISHVFRKRAFGRSCIQLSRCTSYGPGGRPDSGLDSSLTKAPNETIIHLARYRYKRLNEIEGTNRGSWIIGRVGLLSSRIGGGINKS